jgi:peptide/nickel transport system permease protein
VDLQVRRWLIRRGLQSVITLVIVAILLFFLMRLAPGDPLGQMSSERQLTPEQIEATRKLYQLDQPLPRQLLTWIVALAHGNLGTSFTHGRPVTSLIAERLPATLLLGGTVLLVNFTVGLWQRSHAAPSCPLCASLWQSAHAVLPVRNAPPL